MRILAIGPNRASKVIAVAVILLGLVGICVAPKSKREVRSASGTVIGLERYTFRPGRVRYFSGGPAAVRLIRKVLPDAVIDKVKWLRPEVSVFTAPFANEPLLTAQFYSRDASGKFGAPGTRVVVFDEHNQSFDEVVNFMGNNGNFAINAFPRRGKTLRLRLMNLDDALAEFSIPNPCPGKVPRHSCVRAGRMNLPVSFGGRDCSLTIESEWVDGDFGERFDRLSVPSNAEGLRRAVLECVVPGVKGELSQIKVN